MDKDILRLVIIATGLLIMVAMIVWSLFKGRRSKRQIDIFDDSLNGGIDPSLVVDNDNDEFDIIPIGTAQDENDTTRYAPQFNQPIDEEAEQAIQIPNLLQFSLIALADEGFNGGTLNTAFEKVGLVYGSMQIYERIDAENRVDFSVASIVEPGVFPETDKASFYCPGIVFFMQPNEVGNAARVFEDFIDTIQSLKEDLNGTIWDNQRQELTQETINAFRRAFAALD